jgi:hypothetical protein
VFYYKGNKAYIQGLITKFYKTYNLYNFKNIKSFLGIRIIHDRVTKMIWLVHDICIKKLLNILNLLMDNIRVFYCLFSSSRKTEIKLHYIKLKNIKKNQLHILYNYYNTPSV